MASRGLGAGIYCIEHLNSGRLYVGSAISLDRRRKEHFNALNRGKHHSRFLQRAWNKHGEQAFQFRVLLHCAPENLLWYEQTLLDAWRPDYNSAPTAGSQLGFKHGPEAKARMAEAAKRTRNFTGHRHSEETKQRISRKKTGVTFGRYPKERVERAAAAMRAGRRALNESQVRAIREMKALGIKHRDVASEIGCSYWAVADVVRGRSFGWVN